MSQREGRMNGEGKYHEGNGTSPSTKGHGTSPSTKELGFPVNYKQLMNFKHFLSVRKEVIISSCVSHRQKLLNWNLPLPHLLFHEK